MDQLFFQRDLSNLESDCDKVLIDILSLKIYEKKRLPNNLKSVPITGILKVANLQMSIQEMKVTT